MKKKLLILSAAIGLVLACFPFTLCAEEDPESDLGISSPPAYYQLDNYFYDNYILLPFIESNGSQYIQTGVNPNSNYKTSLILSGLSESQNRVYLFGSRGQNYTNNYSVSYTSNDDHVFFTYQSNNQSFEYEMNYYQTYNISFDRNNAYINNELIYSFSDSAYSTSYPIYIFTLNDYDHNYSPLASFKLYSFSIFNYSNEEYVRYYYPAKAKSGGTIGLYDAVSKTFVTSSTADPFDLPDGSDFEMSIYSKITSFIFSSLNWIGDILSFAIAEPVIILFMAIGLAGAMFRWGRRLVHF